MPKDSNNINKWISEFSEFLYSEPVTPSPKISEQLKKDIYCSLNPSPFLVFAKLAVIASVAGLLSTILCPQFGIGSNSSGLMSYFMSISPLLCHVACGVIFAGTGVLAATLILAREELRVLKKTKFLQMSALSATTLGMFVCFGAANVFAIESLWLVGGIGGGLMSLYGGSYVREQVFSY